MVSKIAGKLYYEAREPKEEYKRLGAVVEVCTSEDKNMKVYRSYHFRSIQDASRYVMLLYLYLTDDKVCAPFLEWWNGEGYDGKSAYVLEVGKSPRIVRPKNGTDFGLKEIQSLVDGYIEVVYLSKDAIAIVDEEGVCKCKDLNQRANSCIAFLSGQALCLCGTVVICNTSMLK